MYNEEVPKVVDVCFAEKFGLFDPTGGDDNDNLHQT